MLSPVRISRAFAGATDQCRYSIVIISALAVTSALGQIAMVRVPLCCAGHDRLAALGLVELAAGRFPASACLHRSRTARPRSFQDK